MLTEALHLQGSIQRVLDIDGTVRAEILHSLLFIASFRPLSAVLTLVLCDVFKDGDNRD